MFGFGQDKQKAAEAKAKEEQIAALQQQLEAAQRDAAQGDAAAAQALAAAQAQAQQLQAELAQLHAEAAASGKGGTASGKGGTASGISGALGGKSSGKSGAETVNADKTAPSPGVTLGGAATAAGGLGVGSTAWVQQAGGKNLRLHDQPGLQSNAFASLPPGTQVSLLEGPIHQDGYPWWRIRASDGREGWVAGTELVTSPE